MRTIKRIKTKYYSREILKYLFLAGVVVAAGGGYALGAHLNKKIWGTNTAPKRKSYDAFQYLRRRGLVELRREGADIAIALTEEGRKQAGKYQIDDLVIERPEKWDGKWRIVIFDIPIASNTIRDIFRRKLKEFGFYRLQHSIWVFPFPCREEVELIREFLGADTKQVRFIEEASIEDDKFLREHFEL